MPTGFPISTSWQLYKVEIKTVCREARVSDPQEVRSSGISLHPKPALTLELWITLCNHLPWQAQIKHPERGRVQRLAKKHRGNRVGNAACGPTLMSTLLQWKEKSRTKWRKDQIKGWKDEIQLRLLLPVVSRHSCSTIKSHSLRIDNFISLLFGDHSDLHEVKRMLESLRYPFTQTHQSWDFTTIVFIINTLPELFESEFRTLCPFIPKYLHIYLLGRRGCLWCNHNTLIKFESFCIDIRLLPTLEAGKE